MPIVRRECACKLASNLRGNWIVAMIQATPSSRQFRALRGAVRASLVSGLLACICGCSTPERLAAVPPTLTTEAEPAAGDSLRFWAKGDTSAMAAEGVASIERERAYLASIGHNGPLPPANFLAL